MHDLGSTEAGRLSLTGIFVVASALAAACSSSSEVLADAGADAGIVLCGNSSGGPGTSTQEGTLGGQRFTASEVVGFVGSKASSPAGPVSYAGFALTNVAGACGHLHGPHSLGQPYGLASAATLTALVQRTGTARVAPGTYPITPVGSADTLPTTNAVFSSVDATCSRVASEYSVSGSITLTAVDCASISGSFDVQLANGDGSLDDHMTGTFSAPSCDADPLGPGPSLWLGADAGAACSP